MEPMEITQEQLALAVRVGNAAARLERVRGKEAAARDELMDAVDRRQKAEADLRAALEALASI